MSSQLLRPVFAIMLPSRWGKIDLPVGGVQSPDNRGILLDEPACVRHSWKADDGIRVWRIVNSV